MRVFQLVSAQQLGPLKPVHLSHSRCQADPPVKCLYDNKLFASNLQGPMASQFQFYRKTTASFTAFVKIYMDCTGFLHTKVYSCVETCAIEVSDALTCLIEDYDADCSVRHYVYISEYCTWIMRTGDARPHPFWKVRETTNTSFQQPALLTT